MTRDLNKLIFYFASGDLKHVKKYISIYGRDCIYERTGGARAFVYAIKHGNLDIIKYLGYPVIDDQDRKYLSNNIRSKNIPNFLKEIKERGMENYLRSNQIIQTFIYRSIKNYDYKLVGALLDHNRNNSKDMLNQLGNPTNEKKRMMIDFITKQKRRQDALNILLG